MSDAAPVSTPTPDIQSTMQSSLKNALEGLSKLEMPVVPGNRVQSQTMMPDTEQMPTLDSQSFAAPEEPQAPPPAAPPKQETMWGPAQQEALQRVLDRNSQFESELKQLREQNERYQRAMDSAANGDIKPLTEHTRMTQDELLNSFQNPGKAPVARPQIGRVEETVSALQKRVDELTQTLTQQNRTRQLDTIAQTLSAKDDYAILKQIPDYAARVDAIMQKHTTDARNRGEVPSPLSVEQAASLLKGDFVRTFKAVLADSNVRRELGLGEPTETPANVKRPVTSRALTGDMASSGPLKPKQREYNPDSQLRLALAALKGG